MNIPHFNFKRVTGTSYYNGPGVFIYQHCETGKCFVRALRNSHVQQGKNNYPKGLKALLRNEPSGVILFFSELVANTKETLVLAARAVEAKLLGIDKLYVKPQVEVNALIRYTVWCMTYIDTGAVHYFEAVVGEPVASTVEQRLKTLNNHVAKSIASSNRVMYAFAKQHYPLQYTDWVVRDLQTDSVSLVEALKVITKLSKTHLETNEVVLNKVAKVDSLYYRNAFLKLEHKTMTQYLQPIVA